MKITTEVEITDSQVSDLLCDAFEGGSNYWIGSVSYYYKGRHVSSTELRKLLQGSSALFDSSMPFKDMKHEVVEYPPYIWLPLIKDGEVKIQVEESEGGGKFITYHLNLEELAGGMVKFANQYQKHFQDFINENSDAITGDVFLQCCLFGKIIYG